MTMKHNAIKVGMVALLSVLMVGTLLIVGCGGSQGQGPSPARSHYSGNGISFDYPETWGPGNSDNPNAVATFVSETGEFVVVLKQTMPPGYTLKRFNDETVMSMEPTQVISGTFPTVAGVSACDTVFRAGDSQMRTVILEKSGNVYVIICAAPVAAFDDAQTSFNMVIESFKVQ